MVGKWGNLTWSYLESLPAFADIFNVQDLWEITDLKWLGVDDDSEDHISNLAYKNIKMKKSYIESVVHEVYCAEMKNVK
jgi:hypothetical protein